MRGNDCTLDHEFSAIVRELPGAKQVCCVGGHPERNSNHFLPWEIPPKVKHDCQGVNTALGTHPPNDTTPLRARKPGLRTSLPHHREDSVTNLSVGLPACSPPPSPPPINACTCPASALAALTAASVSRRLASAAAEARRSARPRLALVSCSWDVSCDSVGEEVAPDRFELAADGIDFSDLSRPRARIKSVSLFPRNGGAKCKQKSTQHVKGLTYI